MNRPLSLLLFAWLCLHPLCANSAPPVILRPSDDPRVAHLLAAEAASKPLAPASGSPLANLDWISKTLPIAGTTWHPADVAGDPQAFSSWFGFSIASSADYVVVGAPRMNSSTGKAYLFRRTGPDLSLEATLSASDGEMDDWFGYTVAVEGDTVMVAANRDDVGANMEVGAVYVFERNGANWPQVAKLSPPGQAAFSNYGYSIAIQGSEALVGAVSAGPPSFSGLVYRYLRSNGVWTSAGTIAPVDTQNAQWFGYRLALQGDTLAVAAPLYDRSLTDVGQVLIYERQNNNWTFTTTLLDLTSETREWFGQGLALDQDWIAITAFDRDVNSVQAAGAVMLYRRQNGLWDPLPVQTLTLSPPLLSDNFGISVGLDWPQLWVGRRSAIRPPSVAEYRFAGNQWGFASETLATPPSDNGYGVFSEALAVASDAVFVGAPRRTGLTNLAQVGAVFSLFRTAQITVQTSMGGSTSPSGSFDAPIGRPYTLLLQPDNGYHLESVTGCSGVLDGMQYGFDVTVACSIDVSFANDPPQIQSASAQTGRYEGEAVPITVQATDREPGALSYRFDCDGDGLFEVGPQFDNVGDCVFAHAGAYTAAVRVEDQWSAPANTSVLVTVLNSKPVVQLSAPNSVDEDSPIALTLNVELPSSGEQIVTVEVDCDYDGSNFGVDLSGAPNGPWICPAAALSGPRQVAARAEDNEGEWSDSVIANVQIAPINDAPTFQLGTDRLHGPATIGVFDWPGFVAAISPGPPDEQGQGVIAITATEFSDTDQVVDAISIDLEGRLRYTLSGRAGIATIQVTVTDSGGTPGTPTSPAQTFRIENSPGTDLTVQLQSFPGIVVPGQAIGFQVHVGNAGPNDAAARVQLPLINGLSNQTWRCVQASLASCPTSATMTGALDQVLTLPVGSAMQFIIEGSVSANVGGMLSTEASIGATDANVELVPASNSAQQSAQVLSVELFKSGFE